MSGIILFMVLSFSHVFDIEVPAKGFTLSLLELSYATRNVTVRTSPLVLPFMFPLTLRLSSSHAFLKFSVVPFYGGYFITTSYPDIKKVEASPLYGIGGGMWLGKRNLQIIPDFGVYIQKKTTFFGKLSVRFENLFTALSLGNGGTSAVEALYLLRFGKGFFIFGLRYPGVRDMGFDLPVIPLVNAGVTF